MAEYKGNEVPRETESRHTAGQRGFKPGRIYIGGDPNSWIALIDKMGNNILPKGYADIIRAMGVYGD